MHTLTNRTSWLLLASVLAISIIIMPAEADAALHAAPSASAVVETTYIVRPRDTLWDIANSHGSCVEALLAANPGVNPRRLVVGQCLRIPGGSSSVQPDVHATHVVQRNDTLWTIAVAHDTTVAQLLASNPGLNPRALRIGQALVVAGADRPAPAAVQQAPAAAVAAAEPAGVVDPAADASTSGTSPEAPVDSSAAPVADAAPAPTPEITLAPELADWPAALMASINEKRAAAGLHALTWSAELAAAAQRHADDCASRKYGSHVGSDGARLIERLARCNYAPRWFSENWANARSLEHAMSMWWNEPPGNDPHRRNILGRNYTEIGIGVAKGGWGYYFIADFASR